MSVLASSVLTLLLASPAPEPIAWNDLLPELRVLDTPQRDPAFGDEQRRRLRQRFDHQHTGHQRHAREMALKKLLVDGDVLDGDDVAAGVVLGDVVDHAGGITEREAVEISGWQEAHRK